MIGVLGSIKLRAAELLCFLVLLVGALFPVHAYAMDAAVASDSTSSNPIMLTIYNQHDGHFGAGCKVDIYHVATVNPDGTLAPITGFASYNLSWNVADSSSAQALANALEGYVLRDGITPTDSGVTDANGVIAFPKTQAELNPGYYLVLTESHTYGGQVHEPSPTLLALPHVDETGKADYQPSISLKFFEKPLNDMITIDVTKVWKGGNGNTPKEVIVQLLRDGEVFSTVILSESNGWHHAWENLSNAYKWNIVEKVVPDGYEVSVVKDRTFVAVINSYISDEELLPDTGGNEKLPQTGAMWWPVPLLLLGGLALFAFGAARRSRD